MPKKPGAYYRPKELSEALKYLSQPDTAPLAGGTKLLADEAGVSYAGVVDLQALDLFEIAFNDRQLRVGAMVTLSNLSQFLQEELGSFKLAGLLRQAIRHAGPNTYRNAATLGGVIASRLPDSEFLAALLVLEATLRVYRPEATTIALNSYLGAEVKFIGLITEVVIPVLEGTGGSQRVARTPADYPIVSVTSWRPSGGKPRLAATGLGPRPLRLQTVESQLGPDLNEESVQAAGHQARDANRHSGDFRGDAAYRAEMAAVLTRRVLREL